MEKISKPALLKRLRELDSNNPSLGDYSIYKIVDCIKSALAPYEVRVSYETIITIYAGEKRTAYVSIKTKRQTCRFEIEQYGSEGAYRTYFSDVEFF